MQMARGEEDRTFGAEEWTLKRLSKTFITDIFSSSRKLWLIAIYHFFCGQFSISDLRCKNILLRQQGWRFCGQKFKEMLEKK
jgi:hypothetical protein